MRFARFPSPAFALLLSTAALISGATGCNKEKSTGTSSTATTGGDGTATGTDTTGGGTGSDGTDDGGGIPSDGSHAVYTRVLDDVFIEGPVTSTVTFTLAASDTDFSGTLAYTEGAGDQDWTTCTTSLDIVRVARDPDCTDCEWGYTFFVEPSASASTKGCVFPSPSTSFGLGDGGVLGTISRRAEGPGGTKNVVTIGSRNVETAEVIEHVLYAEDSAGTPLVTAFDPTTNTVNGFSVSAMATGTHLWTDCEGGSGADPEATTTGPDNSSTEVHDDIDCRLGARLADVWEITVSADTNFSASVDSSGEDPMIVLVDPQGCLVTTIDDSVTCTDGRNLCPTFTHTANQDGAYRVVVAPRYCLNETMNYFFDGVGTP